MLILGSGVDAIQPLNESFNLKKVQIEEIEIDKINIVDYQPRQEKITEQSIKELIESISEHGVLQPIIIQYCQSGKYNLIAGERRLKALKLLGIKKVPASIKRVSDIVAHSIAIIENLQRKQLTSYEEAKSFYDLKTKFDVSSSDLSKLIGKNRSTISNYIRCMDGLCEKGKVTWKEGRLEYGHVRAITTLRKEYQEEVIDIVLSKNLSVRKAEELAKKYRQDVLFSKLKSDPLNQDLELGSLLNISTEGWADSFKLKRLQNGKFRILIDFRNEREVKSYLKNLKGSQE